MCSLKSLMSTTLSMATILGSDFKALTQTIFTSVSLILTGGLKMIHALPARRVTHREGCTSVIGRWLLACVAACFFLEGYAYSSDVPNVTFETAWHIHSDDSDQFKAVYRVDLDKMQVREIYRTDWTQIQDLAVSPDKNRVAVLVTRLRFIDGEPEVHNRITVIDGEGEIKYEILGASEGVAWSPDGKALAYTKGVHIEREGFRSTGTFLRDSITGESEKIYDKGLFLHWAAFDKRLYIMNDYEPGEVVVYDAVNHSVNETSYKTINFSPDGKLYWVSNAGADSVHLIATKDGADLTCRYAFLRDRADLGAHLTRWLNDRLLALFDRSGHSFLLDVVNGRTLEIAGNAFVIRGDDIYVSMPNMRIDKIRIDEADVLISEEEGLLAQGHEKD